MTGLDEVRTKEEYRYIIDAFLEQGAKNFLFETNSNTIGLLESARYIRSRVPDAYVIISYAVLPGGYTRDGLFGEDLLQETGASPFVDAVGLNHAEAHCSADGSVEERFSRRNTAFGSESGGTGNEGECVLSKTAAGGEAHCRGIRPIGIRGHRKIH